MTLKPACANGASRHIWQPARSRPHGPTRLAKPVRSVAKWPIETSIGPWSGGTRPAPRSAAQAQFVGDRGGLDAAGHPELAQDVRDVDGRGTPWQAITLVTCRAIPPILGAAIIGLPAGMALQDAVIRAIGTVQSSGGPAFPFLLTPGSVVHVYTAAELALLALAGLAIAIAGALGPVTWAAASKTTTALRAE
jgi:hypothetical protein